MAPRHTDVGCPESKKQLCSQLTGKAKDPLNSKQCLSNNKTAAWGWTGKRSGRVAGPELQEARFLAMLVTAGDGPSNPSTFHRKIGMLRGPDRTGNGSVVG